MLLAVGTDVQVFIFQVISKGMIIIVSLPFLFQMLNYVGDEKLVLRKVETLSLQSQVSSIVFTKDYLSIITSDGGIYLWDPHDSSRYFTSFLCFFFF